MMLIVDCLFLYRFWGKVPGFMFFFGVFSVLDENLLFISLLQNR